jgi:pectate lyase
LLTFSNYGDRAENQFGKDFPGVAKEGWAIFNGAGIYGVPALMQLEIAEKLGSEGAEFLNWTISGLKAFAKYGYNPADNTFRPMWADGTDLSNYSFPRTGYFGPQGKVLKPYKADEMFLFSYTRAYRMSKDQVILETVRSIMKGLGLEGSGSESGKVNMATDNSSPIALFALLEMYRADNNPSWLKLAEVIGDNILKRSYHNGYFLADDKSTRASFSALEPLALLSLEAAIQGKPEVVPVYSGGSNRLDLKTE